MTCEAAKELLSECADALLEHERAVELSSHLNACKTCTRDLELIRGVSKLVRSLPKRDLPAGFLQRLERRRQAPEPAGHLPARALALGFTIFFVGVVVYRAARPKPMFRSAPGAPLAEVAQAPQDRLGRSPARDSGFPISAGGDSLEPPPAAHITPGGDPAYTRPGSGFDNAAQAERMQEETARAGIQGINQQDDGAPQNEPFLGRTLGNPEVHQRAEAQIRQLVAARRAIDDGTGRPKPVPIAGQTAPVLSQSDTTNGAALGDVETSAAPAPVAPSEPWRGAYSGGNEGTRTISDAASWQSLWHSLNPETTAPRIDFTRQEVVAVFLGTRPSGGYSVEITGLTSNESALSVTYHELVPPPGVPPPEGATSPYVLKAIPASSLPVRFVKIP